MSSDAPQRHHRWRAPADDATALLSPSLSTFALELRAGRVPAALPNWLEQLAAEARPDLLLAAAEYTSQYRNVAQIWPQRASWSGTPIIMAGHQPELFHAGVWFKNFVLSRLAGEHQAIGLNLIVDNDLCRHTAIRVPSGDRDHPQFVSIPFDETGDPVSYEERSCRDTQLFKSFPQRVGEAIAPWIADPLVHELWSSAAVNHACGTGNLGARLCRLRHCLEEAWGLRTLEVPISVVFARTPFHRFLLRVLGDLPRFMAVHNDALRQYRLRYHVRSNSHPVPALATESDWLEAPLWIWSRSQPERRRLFVRPGARTLELTDRAHWRGVLPQGESSDDLALEQLAAWERSGIRLRPRALFTTLYARLVLCDLFLHGIGGGKYDELTNELIARYFQLVPPTFVVATATMRLPLGFPEPQQIATPQDAQRGRALRFHGDQFLTTHPAAETKRALLAAIPPRGMRRAWHAALTQCNAMLASALSSQRAEHAAIAEQFREQQRVRQGLTSREFSFCLFPSVYLRTKLTELASG